LCYEIDKIAAVPLQSAAVDDLFHIAKISTCSTRWYYAI